ncbi:hypothetical protein [Streptococcus orisratti]|uniref:hypothetical protein n=1 Tax=Streptococcus orisratti TaxID=114652 RepID=UPI003CFF7B40
MVNGTVKKDTLIKNFFEERMSEDKLKIFLTIFFIEKKNYHVPYHYYSEYVYSYYDSVKSEEEGNDKELFWQDNIYNLEITIKKLKGTADYSDELANIPDKIKEHIELSLLQYGTFFSRLEDVNKKSEELIKGNKESTNQLSKATKKLEASSSEFITILGVFSSFVFIMFGGFTSLSEVLDALTHTNTSMLKIIFIASVLFIFVVSILYLMLYWVGKITDKSLIDKKCACENDCKKPFRHAIWRHSLYLSVIFVPVISSIVTAFLIFKFEK